MAREPPVTRLVDKRGSTAALLETLRSQGQPKAPARFARTPIAEHEVEALFAVDYGLYEYHPKCYWRYRPGIETTHPFSDHPAGQWTRRTNEQGFRRDIPLSTTQPELRVLVVGDSHTDGLCNNSESFCARLESLLLAEPPASTVEVLNAGVMGQSFYGYLGSMEAHQDLKCKGYVVVFFSGNDFLDVLTPLHFFQRELAPPQPVGYFERLKRIADVNTEALTQGFNQMVYFESFPDEADLALGAAWWVCQEMDALARSQQVPWVLVHIPSAFDVGQSEVLNTRRRVMEAAGLSEEHARIGSRLAGRLLDQARSAGIQTLDMSGRFAAEPLPCYWSEFHINLRGHELLAEELLPLVRSWKPISAQQGR